MMPSLGADAIPLVLALVAAGCGSGLLAGFFGVGGGAPVVFALYETFRILQVPAEVRMHLAIGTALAVMIPTAVTSYLAHRRRGSVDERIVRIWAAPTAIGVLLGSFVAAAASQLALKLVFAILAAGLGLRMLLGGPGWRLAGDTPSPAAIGIAGLATGLLSSLMGIGGGVFGNMFLSLYGRPMHQIVGTSASLGILIALPGMLGYMVAGLPKAALLPPGSVGFVSVVAALVVAPVAAACAPLGVALAHRFTAAKLKRAFAFFLLILAARFWISILAGA